MLCVIVCRMDSIVDVVKSMSLATESNSYELKQQPAAAEAATPVVPSPAASSSIPLLAFESLAKSVREMERRVCWDFLATFSHLQVHKYELFK